MRRPEKESIQEEEQAANTESQANSQTEEQAQPLVESSSGITPAIAQAEEILNNTGSSWISQSQAQHPSKK